MFTSGQQIKFLSLIIHGLTLVKYSLSLAVSSNPLEENCIAQPHQNCSSVDGKAICYRVCSFSRLSWNDAQKICAINNSTLPVIRNKREQKTLESYLKSQTGISVAWTSGRKVTHGQWTWLKGRPYEGLIVTESANSGHETHAILIKDQLSLQFKQGNPLHSTWYMCQYRGNACDTRQSLHLTNSCVVLSENDTSWYDARNACLNGGGDLAVLSEEDLNILKSHQNIGGAKQYWIGLGKVSWQWEFLNNRSEEVKYSKWMRSEFPLDTDICISIQASDGQWRASNCRQGSSVICQNKRNRSPGSTPISRTSTLRPMASSGYASSSSESTDGRNISTPEIPISTISKFARTKSYSSTLSSTVRESTVGNISTYASPTSQTSTFGPVSSSRSTNNPTESIDVTTRSESTANNPVVYALIGVGVLLICICIFIFIFLLIRTRKKGPKEIKSSKANTIHSNNGSDLETKKTPDTTIAPAYELQGVYAEISPAKISNKDMENVPNNLHPLSGTVYASLEFKKQATVYAEPVKKSNMANAQTQKVGPLGDIYAVPTPKRLR